MSFLRRLLVLCLLAVLLPPACAFAPEEVRASQLPPEARDTLARIRADGPHPYARDGVVFGNRERRLPPQARGYYREFTVRTPGRRDRGARRIVAGQGGEFYYTDDHYQSFRRIRE
ncbi:MAG: ribonuclease N [Proteobacteria bacterium]|nr:ribonuclease N [Pseudomonadota bacterium]